MKPLKVFALACAAFVIQSGNCSAQDLMALRSEAVISGDVVRLGDIVERAGDKADIALFRSPALGGVGTIKAERIAEATRELGVPLLDLRGLSAITIHRPSRQVIREELAAAIQDALQRQDSNLAEAVITLDPIAQPLLAESAAAVKLSVEIIAYDQKSDRFEARITSGRPGSAIRVSGTADASISMPVLSRNIARGEAIQPADLTNERRKRRSIAAGVMGESAQLSGVVARRNLHAGDLVRDGDVARPNMVEKNQLVTVAYDTSAMTLTMRGKALGNGIAGSIVPVLNLQSKRTIEAVVIGPGRVSARMTQNALDAQ